MTTVTPRQRLPSCKRESSFSSSPLERGVRVREASWSSPLVQFPLTDVDSLVAPGGDLASDSRRYLQHPVLMRRTWRLGTRRHWGAPGPQSTHGPRSGRKQRMVAARLRPTDPTRPRRIGRCAPTVLVREFACRRIGVVPGIASLADRRGRRWVARLPDAEFLVSWGG